MASVLNYRKINNSEHHHPHRPPTPISASAGGPCNARGNQEAVGTLFHELSGITVLVAKKFTNDRTADGLLDAFHLTVGCISLGISQAGVADSNEARLFISAAARRRIRIPDGIPAYQGIVRPALCGLRFGF